jgi:type 1 fimbria pilin
MPVIEKDDIKMAKVFYNLLIMLFIVLGVALNHRAIAAETEAVTIPITVTILATTCKFSSSPSQVTLPPVSANAVTKDGSGVSLPFEIKFMCGDSASGVRVSVTGDPDPADVTAFRNTGTSSGVALRLSDSLGKQTLYPDGSRDVVWGTTGIGQGTTSVEYQIALTGGYTATGSGAVTAGSFASTATFTLFYD